MCFRQIFLRSILFYWAKRTSPVQNRFLSGHAVFSEKRSDISFQDRFHVLFGFLEIKSPHQNGQVFTNSLPTIILRPKHTIHSNVSDQR